jgi:hypothetical protein
MQNNGGKQTSTQIGDITNLDLVWYNPESIANILSLLDVRKVCIVTMDTARDHFMSIHKKTEES